MYRCECCTDVSRPGQPMLKHVLYRRVQCGLRYDGKGKPVPDVRREAAREIALCEGCSQALDGGTTLDQLWADNTEKREQSVPTAAAPRSYTLRQPVLVGYEVTE